jgi:signal transduction histidine kinase
MIIWENSALLAALLASALLLRRWPLAALAVTLGGSVASMVLQPSPSYPLFVFACVVGLEICYIAATRTRRVSVAGAAMGAAGLLIPLLTVPSLGSLRGGSLDGSAIHLVTIAVPLFTIVAWLIGHSIRQAQARAELVRAQAAAQATMAERLRIARELHDMVAHSTGIIAIQAGSGRRVFDTRPDEARDALAAIEATSRETLSGLRRMVTGLRRAEPEHGSWLAPLGPTPGLADIDRLAATALDAGLRVEFAWTGVAAGNRCRPTSTCRRSASSRRPSPTWSATPAPTSAGCRSATRTGSYRSRSPTAAAAAARPGPATGSPA